MSTRNNDKALQPPSTRCVCKVASRHLGGTAGRAAAGRKTASVEGAEQKGRTTNLTARHRWRGAESHAKQMAWGNWIPEAGQERRQQKAQHTSKTKQRKKYRVRCSALVLFFRLVWGFVLHKQPREGLRFSRDFQPRYRNKFENHSDRGRCDFLQQAPTFLFHLLHLQPFPLQGKKKKKSVRRSDYSCRTTSCRQSSQHTWKGESAHLCISFWTLKQHMGCVPLQYVTGSTGSLPNEHAS